MLVSIVIDNYNYGAYIAQAIESALAQTHAPLEVVVVDDGSTDDSLAVIRRYEGRVTVIAKPNGGQGSAYNAGFLRSRGEVVVFLDADDWLDPDAAAQIVAQMGPGVSKVQFPLRMVDRQGRPLGRQLPRDQHDGALAEALVAEFGTYGSPPGSGNAFSAAFLRQVLPMAEGPWRIGADSIPILLAPACGRVVSIGRAMGSYRLHRAASEDDLLYNNWVNSMEREFQRIEVTKAMVVEGLARLGAPSRGELRLAPWEARFMALASRFGEPALRRRLAVHPWGRLGVQAGAVWRWPATSLARKLAMIGWLVAVHGLPDGLALRVGRLHRRAAGLPVAATGGA